MHTQSNEQTIVFLLIVAFFALLYRSRGWRGSGTAFGTATFASDKVLRAAGMLAGKGLVIGRTFSGALLHLPRICHVLLVGGTGSGKGVGVILPNLFTWVRGSIICFDTKGDLYATAGPRRAAMGQRILRVAPFDGGTDSFNPLSTIPRGSPFLVDSARAMAEALVIRPPNEVDPHWSEKSVQVITALLVLILLRVKDEERNLNTVQDIASDPELVKSAALRLRKIGGIPARFGNQLMALFDKDGGGLTKEGAGILSSVSRHLAFLDSELIARSLATSTFSPQELQKPGTTLFIQLPPSQLEAQRGWLRCILSTLVRVIGATGDERDGEVLVLIDEASAMGVSPPAVEETLVRGRSSGMRMFLAYQSPSQVTAAFKDKPTLLYDNCATQIYMGATSYESAERLSKSIGDWTQVVEGYSANDSRSWHDMQPGAQTSRGTTMNYSQNGRALRRPEEILTQSEDDVIVLQRGMAPILARRIKWYEDPDFNPAVRKPRKWFRMNMKWVAIAVIAVLFLWAIISK